MTTISLSFARQARSGRAILAALGALLFMAAVACEKKSAQPVVESRSETKSTNPQGDETVTTEESKQVGSTLVGKTEVKSETSEGAVRSETETVIGTITEYVAGKRIEILTGENKKHRFDLDDREATVQADPEIMVGTRVRLVRSKDPDGRKMIRVSVEPNV